jgi:hypothetical protein
LTPIDIKVEEAEKTIQTHQRKQKRGRRYRSKTLAASCCKGNYT